MTNRYRQISRLWILLLAVAVPGTARGQEPDVALNMADEEVRLPDDFPELDDFESSRIQTIFLGERHSLRTAGGHDEEPAGKRIARQVRSVQELANANRPELARYFLRRLIDSGHDKIELAKLVEAVEVMRPGIQMIFEVERRASSPAAGGYSETSWGKYVRWVRSAKLLAGMNRPELARFFIQRLLEAKLDEKQMTRLIEHFGSAVFVEMAARGDPAPEALALADVVLAAANSQWEDLQRIEGLIGQLQDPSIRVRTAALAGLGQTRGAAVVPMIGVLADPGRADEHANVRAALVRMESAAVGPLLATLESPDEALVAQVVEVLGYAEAKRVTMYLLSPCVSPDSPPRVRQAAREALLRLVGQTPQRLEAASLLAKEARRYYTHRQPLAMDSEGDVTLWQWDAKQKKPVARTYLAADASLWIAARLARNARKVAPEYHDAERLYAATMLEAAAFSSGLESPLPEDAGSPATEVAEMGMELITDVLTHAMDSGHVATAAAAARLLGNHGTAAELLYHNAGFSPLTRAARHPDRRLRLAAVEAILKLDPQEPYAGSSYVPEALGNFSATSGIRRALVASPMPEDAQRIAGLLTQLGFDVDTAGTGRDLFRLAVSSADYELALIDDSVRWPECTLLVQELRHDWRTARMPLGVYARSDDRKRLQRMAERDPLVTAIIRPHDVATITWQVDQLLASAGRTRVPFEERQRQAATAVERLAELSDQPGTLYDLLRIEQSLELALLVPKIGPRVVAVLGNLGTHQGQRKLVDLASRWTLPLELRKAAVGAFRTSTQRHGIRLTAAEVDRQYERYNQSQHLDEVTQKILGLLLDHIEATAEPVAMAEEAQ